MFLIMCVSPPFIKICSKILSIIINKDIGLKFVIKFDGFLGLVMKISLAKLSKSGKYPVLSEALKTLLMPSVMLCGAFLMFIFVISDQLGAFCLKLFIIFLNIFNLLAIFSAALLGLSTSLSNFKLKLSLSPIVSKRICPNDP